LSYNSSYSISFRIPLTTKFDITPDGVACTFGETEYAPQNFKLGNSQANHMQKTKDDLSKTAIRYNIYPLMGTTYTSLTCVIADLLVKTTSLPTENVFVSTIPTGTTLSYGLGKGAFAKTTALK